MSCNKCNSDKLVVPDKSLDLGCGVEPISTLSVEQSLVTPSTVTTISPTDAVRNISNVVKDVSRRFGKVQPGIFFPEESANELNVNIGFAFDELEENLVKVSNEITKRKEDLDGRVRDKAKVPSDIRVPGVIEPERDGDQCGPLFDLNVPPFGVDWVNPLAASGLVTDPFCRINIGCSFCDFPGDLNIPPFPGIPVCGFTPPKSEICGFDFIDPLATARQLLGAFSMFFTQLGAFAYGFFDLGGLVQGFLGNCIMRILNCLGKVVGDIDLTTGLEIHMAKAREQIVSATAIVTSGIAKIISMIAAIQAVITSAISEIFKFVQDVLSLCDPCKLVSAIANPATLPEFPTFGGLLDV
tara:strand:+ start:6012 stop:7076 length:1065 start_codon:yes stop_codon:yes gene_type:complete